MKLRILSALLVLAMLLTVLPAGVLAEDLTAAESEAELIEELLERVQAEPDITEEQSWYDDMKDNLPASVSLSEDSAAAETTASYSTDYPNTWTNTGNQAVDIAMIALTQVGYAETGDNHTKYNAWYYKKDLAVSWCAVFIAWCANQAGVPTSIVKKTALASGYSTSNMQSNSFGAPAYAFSSTTPCVGDIAYITSSGSTSNHVGLVVAVDSSYVYTVEGNSSDTVAIRKYTRSKGYQAYSASSVSSSIHIVFLARPKYTGGTDTAEEETPTSPEIPADYYVGSFKDVLKTAYYADAVQWAIDQEITQGTSTTTFEPNMICSRGQVITFLYRNAGSPKVSGKLAFTDVTSSDYFYDPVRWAIAKQITQGTSDTTFEPDTACTRAQAVTFLWRAAGSPTPTATKTSFTDVEPDDYYYEAVLWAVENGITTGTSSTTFEPDTVCDRAQIVTFLYRENNGTEQ